MRLALHWQILIALIAAVIAGLLTMQLGEPLHGRVIHGFEFFGTLFINGLKMLIVPLVFFSIVCGVMNSGGGRDFGRLGAKTVGYYMLTTSIAALVGLLLINLVRPGLDSGGQPVREKLNLAEATSQKLADIGAPGNADLLDVFKQMVPPNVVKAAVDGQMLGLITFSLLLGFFITRLEGGQRETMENLAAGFFKVMMLITELIMRFAPLGVFALVARTVATTGFDAFEPLARFLAVVFAGLFTHLLIVMPLLLLLLGRLNPLAMFRAMAPAMLTAFSTSSSAATLPVTMDCVEKRAGVSNRISSFVLPLGATVNMDGTALFEVAAALFIAQAYGIELSLTVQATVVLLAILTSIGVAAIPSASMVAIVLILGNLGLPAEGIGLILAVDRVPDMLRTVVNIFGDACGSVLIAKSEGETVLAPAAAAQPA